MIICYNWSPLNHNGINEAMRMEGVPHLHPSTRLELRDPFLSPLESELSCYRRRHLFQDLMIHHPSADPSCGHGTRLQGRRGGDVLVTA